VCDDQQHQGQGGSDCKDGEDDLPVNNHESNQNQNPNDCTSATPSAACCTSSRPAYGPTQGRLRRPFHRGERMTNLRDPAAHLPHRLRRHRANDCATGCSNRVKHLLEAEQSHDRLLGEPTMTSVAVAGRGKQRRAEDVEQHDRHKPGCQLAWMMQILRQTSRSDRQGKKTPDHLRGDPSATWRLRDEPGDVNLQALARIRIEARGIGKQLARHRIEPFNSRGCGCIILSHAPSLRAPCCRV